MFPNIQAVFIFTCRRYNGHKRTIRPNAKKLGRLLPARHNMSWAEFAENVRHFQKGFMGDPMEVTCCPLLDIATITFERSTLNLENGTLLGRCDDFIRYLKGH